MQVKDYLLVHGPTGTGKTSVIAEIVKRLCSQGQRVMLAAFTNQAVDNMLKRLETEGFHDFVRLGSERSVDEAIRDHLLKDLVQQQRNGNNTQQATAVDPLRAVHALLRNIPVIASTTATWSSEKYAPSSLNGAETNNTNSFLKFDVAIIDEAGQLTVPAILGALRFTKRFILVDDEKQLPPLVLTKESANAGLAGSLFSTLKQLDDDYMKNNGQGVSSCVPLKVQYRMNGWISHFASKVFYCGQRIPHTSLAKRRRQVTMSGPGVIAEMPSIVRAVDPQYPLVFLDVSGEQEKVKISNAEARTVRALVAALLSRGVAQKDIGIITPYRPQVANLRPHLFSHAEASGWQQLRSATP